LLHASFHYNFYRALQESKKTKGLAKALHSPGVVETHGKLASDMSEQQVMMDKP
jgi:hypothetical protein